MRQRTRHFVIGLFVAAAAVAAAALASILPRQVSPPPGATSPPILTDGAGAPINGREKSVEGESVMYQFEPDASDSFVPLNVAAFDQCPTNALTALQSRVVAAVERRASRGEVSKPTRPVIEYKGRYPYRIDATEIIGSEPTPIYLLPSPTTARQAMKDFLNVQTPNAQSLREQADAFSRSAVMLFFSESYKGGRPITHYVPTPRGHPAPTPGVTKHWWQSLRRAVVTATETERLTDRAAQFAKDFGQTPYATMWSLPLNDIISLSVLEENGAQRSWISYSVLDGVGGWPPGVTEAVSPSGRMAISISFSSEQNPKGPDGHSLLRVPATNATGVEDSIGIPKVVPGERIALDEWFAHTDRGFAIVVHTDESVPGHPAYQISTDPLILRDPNVRNRVEMIAIFESIDEKALHAVIDAYLDVE